MNLQELDLWLTDMAERELGRPFVASIKVGSSETLAQWRREPEIFLGLHPSFRFGAIPVYVDEALPRDWVWVLDHEGRIVNSMRVIDPV